MFEHRHSIGSSGSIEVPPAFRASLNVFEDGEVKNPLLPSFFRDDEGNIVPKSASSNGLEKEFVFSLKHTNLQEGPYLSLQHIIDFQSRVRGYLQRKVYKKCTKNIVQLQALGRGFLQRQRFHAIIQASIRCQSIVRRYLVQREARRLYDIQNPPQIRKLRNQIAAIQLKLDAIQEEREHMNRERERRKAQVRKDCLERFAKIERNKTLGIADVRKSGSQLISYFQTENNALRETMRELAKNIADLRSENKSLERDSQVVARYTHELHTHYKKMKVTNGSLQHQMDKLRNRYKIKWEDAINERENYAINEARQKYIYRQGLFRIVDNVLLDQSCDPDFKDDIARVVGRSEDDFNCELDIDTPPELYPAPPELKSMLSTFEPDDKKSATETEEDEPFEFLDDADFLLPGLQSFNPSMLSDGMNLDDSSTTSSSSGSSSSTDSSNGRSQVSDNSFGMRPSNSESPTDVTKYFEQNNASTISPISKNHLDGSNSTVCSTDESEYEVQSVSVNTEDCDPVKIVVNDELESDSEDSGTASSMPPWETNHDTNVPAIISIPSNLELEGKAKNAHETLTVVSTASTTAIESESSSFYVDVDIMDSRNRSLEQPISTATLQAAKNEGVDVHLSSLLVKEPTTTLHEQSASRCDSDAKEENRETRNGQSQPKHLAKQKAKSQALKNPGAKILPKRQAGIDMSSANTVLSTTSRSELSEITDQKQHRFRAPNTAQAISKPKTPYRPRKPSPKLTVANPKPFRARPAPKFGEPKIPVKDRDPGKLRSKSQARRAISPQKSH